MSKKHEKRTRAEILAKRAQPIPTIQVMKKIMAPNGQTVLVPYVAKVRKSKYMPHFGAKQQAKLAKTALKLAA